MYSDAAVCLPGYHHVISIFNVQDSAFELHISYQTVSANLTCLWNHSRLAMLSRSFCLTLVVMTMRGLFYLAQTMKICWACACCAVSQYNCQLLLVSLRQKIQELNLESLYWDSANVCCQWLLSLAFVSTPDAVATFAECKNNGRAEVLPLYDYGESTYIRAPCRRRRHAPLNRFQNCNRLLREQKGPPRTNNSVEGWHHGFQIMIGTHPHRFWPLLNTFRKSKALLIYLKID